MIIFLKGGYLFNLVKNGLRRLSTHQDKHATKRCKIFNHQDNAQSNQRRINQMSSDPDADFCETNVALCQELH